MRVVLFLISVAITLIMFGQTGPCTDKLALMHLKTLHMPCNDAQEALRRELLFETKVLQNKINVGQGGGEALKQSVTLSLQPQFPIDDHKLTADGRFVLQPSCGDR